jgi:hypothetical protein
MAHGVDVDIRTQDGCVRFDGKEAYPPDSVTQWLVLDAREVPAHSITRKLVQMNDAEKRTFAEIADYIEKEFEL